MPLIELIITCSSHLKWLLKCWFKSLPKNYRFNASPGLGFLAQLLDFCFQKSLYKITPENTPEI
jgi:hypothetical protein